jgi:hypothetical protein
VALAGDLGVVNEMEVAMLESSVCGGASAQELLSGLGLGLGLGGAGRGWWGWLELVG